MLVFGTVSPSVFETRVFCLTTHQGVLVRLSIVTFSQRFALAYANFSAMVVGIIRFSVNVEEENCQYCSLGYTVS